MPYKKKPQILVFFCIFDSPISIAYQICLSKNQKGPTSYSHKSLIALAKLFHA